MKDAYSVDNMMQRLLDRVFFSARYRTKRKGRSGIITWWQWNLDAGRRIDSANFFQKTQKSMEMTWVMRSHGPNPQELVVKETET